MGGLVIDVVVALLDKVRPAFASLWGSNKWKPVQAKIDSSWLGGSWVFNCPTAEAAYTYEFGGQTYSAIDSKPFFIENSAKLRVVRHRAGQAATIRVNPVQPQESLLRQADQ